MVKEINIGDIYWLQKESTVPHPYVVIEVDDPNVSVCAITTNRKKSHMPGNVLLNLREGNLNKESIVEVSKVFVIDKSELGTFIGSLTIDRVDEIKRGINFINRSFFNKSN